MYLHIGNNIVLKTQDIVGIFDLDTATISRFTRSFLSAAQKAGEVITVTNELPKSFIVCKKKNSERKIYISQISSSTLMRRFAINNNINSDRSKK